MWELRSGELGYSKAYPVLNEGFPELGVPSKGIYGGYGCMWYMGFRVPPILESADIPCAELPWFICRHI